jgi:hypothetical protein
VHSEEQVAREDISGIGKQFRAADRILFERLITIHPEPKLVALLQAERSRADSYPAVETKAQLEGVRQGFRELIKTFEAVASTKDINDLRNQLQLEGLTEPAQLISDPLEHVRKVLAKGYIANAMEFRVASEYAEDLFENDDRADLERLNELLADYVKRKSPRR